MSRGRRCKPSALKILEGNPGHREIPADEPQPPPGQPPVPDGFEGRLRYYWFDFCRILVGMRVLTQADGPALEGLCYARLHGTTDAKASANFRAWCAEFGLTPASRAKVKITPAVESDPLEQLMREAK